MTEETMRGKTVLITGASDGIGKQTAFELAKMEAELILVGRNPQKIAATAEEIRAKTGNTSIETLVGDLSSQAEVRRVAQEFLQRHSRLDVLVNNAGAIYMKRQVNQDGLEMTFALNHLGYFLLTHLLLDALRSSGAGRIVNVSSEAHRGFSMNLDDLQNERSYTNFRAYGQSKLANIYFTRGMAAYLDGDSVTCNSLHPGFVSTNFGRSNGGLFDTLFRLMQVMAISPEDGAKTNIYLASSPEVTGETGEYFIKNKKANPSEISKDMNIAWKLWEISMELTSLKAPA